MNPVAAFFATLLFVVIGAAANAQMSPLPIDPAVRTGRLDNGLTYFIRHNELPKGQAEFYISQRVGSMQEEDNQRGLAHFLEHMAFNGTENFPDKRLLEYLESVGAKFGNNINAGTGFDFTNYTLMNIPVVRQGVVDSALLVLRDWSCGISLHDKEIDAERGVIHEEWRTRQSAQMRIYNQVLPEVYGDNRYGHRLPIGTMEVIDNFKYQELRDYYKRWYRPDLQAVVVVGDIDVDAIEAKIKSLFGPIAMPANPVERVYFPVPDNNEPIVSFARDKELTNVQTMIMYKHDPLPGEMRNTMAFYVQNFVSSMVVSMANDRLNEISRQPNPPFIGAGFNYGDFIVSSTKDAFTGVVVTGENGIERGVKSLLTEIRRIDQHGFTAAEYERAKANFMTGFETVYNERDKRRNNAFAREYMSSFTDVEPIPGLEAEYELHKQLVSMLSLEVVNRAASDLISDNNIVFTMQGPDKEGVTYPSKDQVISWLSEAATSNTEAYKEEISNEPLVSSLRKAGKVKKISHDARFDATVWTLSNGARVVIKPTAYKDDEIIMRAVSPGGSSLIGTEYDNEAMLMNDLANIGGMGNFSATDLPKVLAGRRAGVSGGVGELDESVSANCAPRDLETMMQLVYLRFTAVRADADAFESWKTRNITALRNRVSNPSFVYSDSLQHTLFPRNPRRWPPTVELIESVDYNRALELFRARYADASNFTFVFVGNIDPTVLQPLVERYIASLPSTKKNRETAGQGVTPRSGVIDNTFERVVETPKVSMAYITSANVEPTLKNSIEMDAVRQVLDSRYIETLREGEGGTYGAHVQGNINPRNGNSLVLVALDTNAAQSERLGSIVVAELEKLATDGPSDVDLQKVKEYMLKTDTQNRQENGYWLGQMSTYYLYGVDYTTAYREVVNGLTGDDVRDFARRLLDAGNRAKVVMNGVAAQ
jgi:zinc protease